MTNPTRTRAEILKDWVEAERERDTHVERIEELQEENTQAWPREGDKVALIGEVFRIPSPSHRGYGVRLNGDMSFGSTIAEYTEFIPAADLIPREEHERALEEAAPAKLDANTALKYLVNEYDLDTGHMDTVGPRTYPFDHNGHIYEVVVRRKGEADVAPAQAVAPKGVVKELRAIARKYAIAFMDWNPNDKARCEEYQSVDKELNAALSRITELPPPSEDVKIENGVKPWTRIPLRNGFYVNIGTKDEALYIAADAVKAAALLAKEAAHD